MKERLTALLLKLESEEHLSYPDEACVDRLIEFFEAEMKRKPTS